MHLFEHDEFDDHEQVVFCRDVEAELRAIIAIHSTRLGPAAGGCRMWPYDSEADALTDVLRLSAAMSYKNALAGLPLGGGKSVIIADASSEHKPALLTAFAQHVQRLAGTYYTAEDIGVGPEDIRVMAAASEYVFGLPDGTGDPSPFTARGVFEGLRAAVGARLGRDDLAGVRVAVQGVGHVGYHLCRLLHEHGAELIAADPDPDSLARVRAEFGATVVELDEIYGQDADVFAPCAVGGVVNDATIPQLRVSVVAGAANNQLARPEHGQQLHDRGIMYAPDYVINAGGMLSASGDIWGEYDRDETLAKVTKLFDTTRAICSASLAEGRPASAVADGMAREIVAAGSTG